MFEGSLSVLSIWASMNSWLTPTVLFLLLNLMIGTIAVTSGLALPKLHDPDTNPDPNPAQSPQRQLTRSGSVLHRLRSIKDFTFRTHHHQQTQTVPDVRSEDPTPDPDTHLEETETQVDQPGEGPSMDEIYMKIKQGQFDRSKSDTTASGSKKVEIKLEKSTSEKPDISKVERKHTTVQRPRAVAAREVGDEEVDAKAADFINRFKEQLQLQRLESLVGYATRK